MSSSEFDGRVFTREEFERLDKLWGRQSQKNFSRFPFVTSVVEDFNNNIRIDEMIVWCVDNVMADWSFGCSRLSFNSCVFAFQEETDAVAFKLRFDGVDYVCS